MAVIRPSHIFMVHTLSGITAREKKYAHIICVFLYVRAYLCSFNNALVRSVWGVAALLFANVIRPTKYAFHEAKGRCVGRISRYFSRSLSCGCENCQDHAEHVRP